MSIDNLLIQMSRSLAEKQQLSKERDYDRELERLQREAACNEAILSQVYKALEGIEARERLLECARILGAGFVQENPIPYNEVTDRYGTIRGWTLGLIHSQPVGLLSNTIYYDHDESHIDISTSRKLQTPKTIKRNLETSIGILVDNKPGTFRGRAFFYRKYPYQYRQFVESVMLLPFPIDSEDPMPARGEFQRQLKTLLHSKFPSCMADADDRGSPYGLEPAVELKFTPRVQGTYRAQTGPYSSPFPHPGVH